MVKEITVDEYLDKLEREDDKDKSYDELMVELKVLEQIKDKKGIDLIKYLV